MPYRGRCAMAASTSAGRSATEPISSIRRDRRVALTRRQWRVVRAGPSRTQLASRRASRPTTSAAQSSPTWRIAVRRRFAERLAGRAKIAGWGLIVPTRWRDDDRRRCGCQPAASTYRSMVAASGQFDRIASVALASECRQDPPASQDPAACPSTNAPAVHLDGPVDLVSARVRRGGGLSSHRARGLGCRHPAEAGEDADEPLRHVDLAELRHLLAELPLALLRPDERTRPRSERSEMLASPSWP